MSKTQIKHTWKNWRKTQTEPKQFVEPRRPGDEVIGVIVKLQISQRFFFCVKQTPMKMVPP